MKTTRSFLWNVAGIFPSSIVLMFHHVDMPDNPRSKCLLSTENFFSLMRNIKSFIPCEELITGKIKNYGGKVAITFDDGLIDVYSIAYPFLRDNNIPFTVFIVTDFLNADGYITTAQLIEMANDPLVTIGSHGVSHKILPLLSSQQKWIEINESKVRLARLINQEITLFAYSHGQYDKECLDMVKRAKYKGAFGVRGAPVNFYSRNWTYHFPRYDVVNEQVDRIRDIIHFII